MITTKHNITNQPPETYLLGYASNKKEFVDLVYENLHPNRI